MTFSHKTPIGDPKREAIDSLRGYVYQIYQSALAWTEIKDDEFLYLEVAEDYAVVAATALKAVQVKETAKPVTINSPDILTSIDSFVDLKKGNPSLNVTLRHLTTSQITKEQSSNHRIGETPTLTKWRHLAKAGDLTEFRVILNNSKLSKKTKEYIAVLSDSDFRDEFLQGWQVDGVQVVKAMPDDLISESFNDGHCASSTSVTITSKFNASSLPETFPNPPMHPLVQSHQKSSLAIQ